MLGQTWQQMRGTQLPCRYYRCPCGFWHLTHKPPRNGGSVAGRPS